MPFIARYRKEATGSLDEVAITADPRPPGAARRAGQAARGDPQVAERARAADRRTEGEDSTPPRPWPCSRTSTCPTGPSAARAPPSPGRRASSRWPTCSSPRRTLRTRPPRPPGFVDAEKGVATAEEALAGARDIIAEWVSEDQEARAQMRELFAAKGVFSSRVIAGKEAEGAKFRDYFDWEEPVATAPSHRVLAMRRGENEKVPDAAHRAAGGRGRSAPRSAVRQRGTACAAEQVRRGRRRTATSACCAPSMETEIRLETKKRADEEAIRVFAENLRAAAAGPAAGAEERAGHRPRLPHRLQGRLPRPPGQAPAQRRDLSAQRARTEPRQAAETLSRARRAFPRSRPSPSATARPAARRRPSSGHSACPATSRSSWSTRAAPRSTPPRRSPARSSPTRTSPCAARSPSAGGSWTRWPSWSRSTPSPSASASTSTMSTRARSSAAWTTWW